MKAIRVHKHGGPEVLSYDEVDVPEVGAGEALIKTEAIGVNFIDIYQRKGLYPQSLPFIPGMEASGIVEAAGSDVSEVKKGDRVAYAIQTGSYAEYAVVPSWKLARVPDNLSFQQACAAMLQGMTAHYLATDTFPLKKGNVALVHAAAGGVGLLLTQIAKMRGATVIGTVSSEEKARIARESGADYVIIYTEQDFETEVKNITNGKGVDIVYDSVGQTTFAKSLNCLKARGTLALFGQSSGPVPPFDLSALAKKGLFVTRPGLGLYVTNHEELLQRSGDLFQWIESGKLKIRIDKTFHLKDAALAHQALENRHTAGKLLLVP